MNVRSEPSTGNSGPKGTQIPGAKKPELKIDLASYTMQNFQMDAAAFSPQDPNQSRNISATAFLKKHQAPLDTDGSNFKELIRRFDNALKELGLTDKRMRPQCLAAFPLA